MWVFPSPAASPCGLLFCVCAPARRQGPRPGAAPATGQPGLEPLLPPPHGGEQGERERGGERAGARARASSKERRRPARPLFASSLCGTRAPPARSGGSLGLPGQSPSPRFSPRPPPTTHKSTSPRPTLTASSTSHRWSAMSRGVRVQAKAAGAPGARAGAAVHDSNTPPPPPLKPARPAGLRMQAMSGPAPAAAGWRHVARRRRAGGGQALLRGRWCIGPACFLSFSGARANEK